MDWNVLQGHIHSDIPTNMGRWASVVSTLAIAVAQQ